MRALHAMQVVKIIFCRVKIGSNECEISTPNAKGRKKINTKRLLL